MVGFKEVLAACHLEKVSNFGVFTKALQHEMANLAKKYPVFSTTRLHSALLQNEQIKAQSTGARPFYGMILLSKLMSHICAHRHS